jgi:hypothetical protein
MRRQPPQEEEDIFDIGEVIDDQYTVVKKLGRGGYGMHTLPDYAHSRQEKFMLARPRTMWKWL